MRRFLAAATLALLAACGNGGALEPTQLSAIRLYNGSFDSPAVNVFLRGTVLSQGLAFGHGQFHVFVQPGTALIEVRTVIEDDVLLDFTAALAAGSSYTFAFTGPASAQVPVFLLDDTTAAPAGNFKIRLIHLAPLGPSMDLYATGVNDDVNSATPVLTATAYTKASSYVNVPVGNLRLRATQAGTKTVLWDTRDAVNFTSGQGISLFLIGKAGAGGGGAPYQGQLVADHS
jgi:hypothetical protein